jgi:CTP synthase (UTP-ammonia lyase)
MPAMPSEIRIALVGDCNEQHKAHMAIPKSLAAASEGRASVEWIATEAAAKDTNFPEYQGIWVVPGMPYRSVDGVMRAIQHARTSRTPFLGTSAGFQYTVLEFARNVLGLAEADHQKSNPKASMPLISPLGCGLAGVKARVRFMSGTHLRKAYGVPESIEQYYCSFGLNNRYRRLIEGGALCVSAVDDQNDVRAVELDGHPFFVATLFQPELSALEEGAAANPLVKMFFTACAREHSRLARVAS